LKDRQRQRGNDEEDKKSGGQLVQKGGRAARAKGRLRSAAAERAREIRSLPLLQKDDEDQEETDEDVQYD
jgi:hypothetical protein